MKMRILGAACVLCLFLSAAVGQVTVSVAPDAASREDVQRLFAVMNSADQTRRMMSQVMTQMRSMNREQLKKSRPDISEEELARMDRESEELIKSFSIDEMLNDMIPVYQRHFTKSDIDSLITFYSSPVGQKFLGEMPAVTMETMQVVYPRIRAQVEAAIKRAQQKNTSSSPN